MADIHEVDMLFMKQGCSPTLRALQLREELRWERTSHNLAYGRTHGRSTHLQGNFCLQEYP